MENNKLSKMLGDKKITRKQALKKAGITLTALTAASLTFLDTKAQALTSPGEGTNQRNSPRH